MSALNITDLVKVVTLAVLLSISIGKFEAVSKFAIKAGLRAITQHGYKPNYFFGKVRER
jgi:hypothetical protein